MTMVFFRLRALLGALGLAFVCVAQAEERAPLVVATADDELKICADLSLQLFEEAWVQRMGLRYVCKSMPWKRAQQMVREQQCDAFITSRNGERARYTVSHKVPVISFPIVLATSSTHPHLKALKDVTRLDQLKNYRALAYLGNGWVTANLIPLGIKVDWTPQAPMVLKKLALGRGDFTLLSDIEAAQLIAQTKLNHAIIVLPQVLGTTDYYLQLTPNSSYRDKLDELDLALSSMQADGTSQQIYNRYLQSWQHAVNK